MEGSFSVQVYILWLPSLGLFTNVFSKSHDACIFIGRYLL